MKWDFFISHASEDKKHSVDSLAKRLKTEGYRVWYDNFSLKAGDSIRRSIDKGICHSKYGLVILSENFFKKEWPQKELDALMSIEPSYKCQVIPVWLEIGIKDIRESSPLLADKYAITVNRDEIDKVLSQISQIIKPRKSKRSISDKNIDLIIEKIITANHCEQPYLAAYCVARFHQIVAFNNEIILVYESDENNCEDAIEKLRIKYELPEDIYMSASDKIKSGRTNNLVLLIRKWVKGRLKPMESYELYFLLDEALDLDFLYVYFGISNYSVSAPQHERLRQEALRIGCRKTGEIPMDETEFMGYTINKYFKLQ